MSANDDVQEISLVLPRWLLDALVVSAEGRGTTVTNRLHQILSRHLQGELAE